MTRGIPSEVALPTAMNAAGPQIPIDFSRPTGMSGDSEDMTSRMHRIRRTLVVGLGVTVMAAAMAAKDDRTDPRPGRRAAAPVAVKPVIDTPGVDVSLRIRPDRRGDLLFDLGRMRGITVGDVIEISLGAAGVDRYEVRDARRERGSDRWWRLVSIDHADGIATLARSGDMVAGWLRSPAYGEGFEWTLTPMGAGRLRPMPRDHDLPGCGGIIEPPPELLGMEQEGRMGPFIPGRMDPDEIVGRFGEEEDDPVCAGCSALVADLAFFYTPAVLDEVESIVGDPEDAHDVIAARCLLECANTTQSMENSELPFGVRSVHVGLVDWTSEDQGDILGKFASTDDGEMDEIHEIRAEVGADACSLITMSSGGGGYCGVAYLGNGNSPGAAFNNLLWGCMGFTLLAHEFGHNIGTCHAAGDGGGCDEATDCSPWDDPVSNGCCRPDPSGPDTDAPRFNTGWRWVNPAQVPACRRTVMAYGPGATELNYSNPDVQIAGMSTGSPEDDPGERWADNARVIRATMPGTVSYFCEVPESAGADGRLVAGSLGEFDNFGSALATNGVSLFAGASRHDSQGQNAGAVFVFADEIESDPTDPDPGWIQEGKLAAPDLMAGDLFGASVSASDDLLVIGAPYASRVVTEIDDQGEEVVVETFPLAGRAEVWVDDGAGYCRVAVLQPDDLLSNDVFGTSVAVAGELIAVGAPYREGEAGAENRGFVYVYQRMEGDVFELLEVIEGTQEQERIGAAVAMSVLSNDVDQMLLIGAPEATEQRGYVQPIRYVGDGTGDFVSTPVARLNGSMSGDRFGAAMAMYEDDAIIGAPDSRSTRGSARAYRIDGIGLVQTELLLTPAPGGGVEGDRFGASVAISDVRLLIGAPGIDVPDPDNPDENLRDDVGAVFVYEGEDDGVGWDSVDIFRPAGLQPGDSCGTSTAIAGTVLFAGAPDADDAGILSGVVYAFYLSFEDCNENGIDDSLDIYQQTSSDENLDGIPDECLDAVCTADIDGNGLVDGADLGLLFVAWGECPGDPGCPGDLDENGLVDGADLGLMALAYGLICEDPEP